MYVNIHKTSDAQSNCSPPDDQCSANCQAVSAPSANSPQLYSFFA